MLTNDISNLSDTLRLLDETIKQCAPCFYESLQPGLSESGIARIESKLALSLPKDFKVFYRWRNGLSLQDHLDYPVWIGWLMSDDRIIELVEERQKEIQTWQPGDFPEPPYCDEESKNNWWNKGWIPFISYEDGDYLCLDTVGSFPEVGGNPGQLLRYSHNRDYREILYPSFHEWLAVIIRILQRFPDIESSATSKSLVDEVGDFVGDLLPEYPIFGEVSNHTTFPC